MRKQNTQRRNKPSPVPMLLRRLLTEEHGNKPDLKQQLIAVLEDPRELLSCGILDEDHHLYRNVLAVEDALEAVTNGMENPAVLERLDEVPDDSLVAPWKQTTWAIKALYDGDREALSAALAQIPAGSPPRRLAELVMTLSAPDEAAGPHSRAIDQFRKKLFSSPDFVASAGDQMEEALEMGMEDLFCDTAAMLVRDLDHDYPGSAPEFALWSFNRLARDDFSLMPLIKRFRPVFGAAETMRLAALGVAGEDTDAALFYWLKYMIVLLNESAPPAEEIAAALQITADLADQGSIPYEQEELDTEDLTDDELLFVEQINKLLSRVATEIRVSLPDAAIVKLTSPAACRNAARLLGAEEELAPLKFHTLEQPEPSNLRQRGSGTDTGREPMQLELFA